MMLSEKELNIYKRIDFYTRFRGLSAANQFENTLEDYSNDEVASVITRLGYKATHKKKDNFFQIKDTVGDCVFTLNIIPKYAKVELVIAVVHKYSTMVWGGPFTLITKLIEMSNGIDNEGYIRYPGFRTYDDLEVILKEAFSIYDDFKKEVVVSDSD